VDGEGENSKPGNAEGGRKRDRAENYDASNAAKLKANVKNEYLSGGTQT